MYRLSPIIKINNLLLQIGYEYGIRLILARIMIKRYVLCIYKSGNDKQQCDTRMVAYQIIITTEKERLH